MEAGLLKDIPFRQRVDFRRLGREHYRGQHDVETGHRRLQLGAQLAPPPHRLQIVDPGDERAQHQPGAHPLAEIGQRRVRAHSSYAAARRRSRSASLQACQSCNGDNCTSRISAPSPRSVSTAAVMPSALRVVADLVVGFVEVVDHADLDCP